MEVLEALGGESMARDPDRRVSIAPAVPHDAVVLDSTLGAAGELSPRLAAPAQKKVWSPDARRAAASSPPCSGFSQPAAPSTGRARGGESGAAHPRAV